MMMEGPQVLAGGGKFATTCLSRVCRSKISSVFNIKDFSDFSEVRVLPHTPPPPSPPPPLAGALLSRVFGFLFRKSCVPLGRASHS